MSKYNGFTNKDTCEVITLIFNGGDEELIYFCTNSEQDCVNRINEYYIKKFPQLDHSEVVKYFANMECWTNYLNNRENYLGTWER